MAHGRAEAELDDLRLEVSELKGRAAREAQSGEDVAEAREERLRVLEAEARRESAARSEALEERRWEQ